MILKTTQFASRIESLRTIPFAYLRLALILFCGIIFVLLANHEYRFNQQIERVRIDIQHVQDLSDDLIASGSLTPENSMVLRGLESDLKNAFKELRRFENRVGYSFIYRSNLSDFESFKIQVDDLITKDAQLLVMLGEDPSFLPSTAAGPSIIEPEMLAPIVLAVCGSICLLVLLVTLPVYLIAEDEKRINRAGGIVKTALGFFVTIGVTLAGTLSFK